MEYLDKSLPRAEFVIESGRWGMQQAATLGLFTRNGGAGIVHPTVLEEAAGLYQSRSLMPIAAMLSAAHPHAIDYLKQCPALVLAVMNGHPMAQAKKRHMVLTQWCQLVTNGITLDYFMRLFRLPKPIRKIRAGAISPKDWPVIAELAKFCDPSTLSQIIPLRQTEQRRWLQGLSAYRTQARYKLRMRPDDLAQPTPFLRWLAANGNRRMEPSNAQVCADLADFVAENLGAFNERWDWDGMIGRMHDWERTVSEKSVASDAEVDPFPFERRVNVEGYEFITLVSGKELFEEGQAMQHCVGTYAAPMYGGACRIVSVRLNGVRMATIEYRLLVQEASMRWTSEQSSPFHWRLAQSKARFNYQPDRDTAQAISHYTTLFRERAKILWKGAHGLTPRHQLAPPGTYSRK